MDKVTKVDTEMYMADGTVKKSSQIILVEKEITVKVVSKTEEICNYVIVCTDTNIKELVLGRLLTDGIIRDKRDISDFEGNENGEVIVELNARYNNSDNAKPRSIRREYKDYPKEYILKLIEEFSKESALHRMTKSAHSCYLLYRGEIVFSCEDISRHNAVDKTAGYIFLDDIDPEECIIYTSGRVPLDMITKVDSVGIPILVAKAVPTDRALQYAFLHKIVLIARARSDSFEVFS